MSLPSRERGLKFAICDGREETPLMSLPSRERGLKCLYYTDVRGTVQSLPSRERGLKLMENVEEIQQWGRSPRGSVD